MTKTRWFFADHGTPEIDDQINGFIERMRDKSSFILIDIKYSMSSNNGHNTCSALLIYDI